MPLDHSTPVPNATIFTVLADRARIAPDGRLVAYTAAGILGIGVVLIVRPAWWLLILPCLAFSAFGTWGIADRIIAERSAEMDASAEPRVGITVLRGVKRSAAVIGTLAGVGTFLAGVALVVGPWTL